MSLFFSGYILGALTVMAVVRLARPRRSHIKNVRRWY